MKTIIVATDFSAAAQNAANYAAGMAHAINADIFLFYAYQIPVIYSEASVAVSEAYIRKGAEKKLFMAKREMIRKTGGKLNIEAEVRPGSFFSELKTVCETIKPYTVVMGSQGTTATERLFFGGHAVFAMKYLMWPLITVPKNANFSYVKKIGLACDLNSVVDTTPIDEIKMLVNDFNAELHVLNISPKKEFSPYRDFEATLLEEMLGKLKHNYHFIINANVDECIIDFVETNHIDLLIVLPKRHGLIKKLMHKSHKKVFVLHSPVPVMALYQ